MLAPAVAYERRPGELPPDSPATVGDLRPLRRLVATAAVFALAALVVAVLAYLNSEQGSRSGQDQSEVSEIKDRLDGQEDRIERVSSGEERLDERVAELERNQDPDDTADLERSVERSESEVAKQQQRLDGLEERVNRLAQR